MATSEHFLFPREIAERNRVDVQRVLSWIHSGDLRALDLSSRRGGRPRWAVRLSDLIEFEQSRLFQPAPTQTPRRRRRTDSAITEYF
jgi:hypothetical protein